jgi:HD-GYP domain-containing protein (c-di-GMP phosphodiesterase class II)
MSSITEILTPERSPAVEAQLVAARKRARLAPSARELLIEVTFATGFVVAALVTGLLADQPRAFHWASGLVLVLAAAVASRVVFSVGSTYTAPIQLAFVPMLFVLPTGWAPAALAVGFAAAAAWEVVAGRLAAAKLWNALADAWFAIPPTLVLIAAGSPSAEVVAPATLAATLAAYVAGDFAFSTLRERLHTGASLREQAPEAVWVYLVDVLLAPFGFLVALGAESREWVVVFPCAIFAMLSLFSREREQRLDQLVELNEAYRGTALVLGDVIEYDDAYTGKHTFGVVDLARRVATRLGLDAGQQRNVEFGALLHDVGKIAVPKDIINKPGPLSADEWEVIKTHTVEGERMLDRIGGLMADIGRIVRSAHERWDGGGYPDGLRGEEIPIESRIILCCDAFNAMTTDRSYRSARSQDAALAELRANSGTQFDPRVVTAVIATLAESPDPRG